MSVWCVLCPIDVNYVQSTKSNRCLVFCCGYAYILLDASHLMACWNPTRPGSSSLHSSFFDTAFVSQQRITLFDGCSQITCPMANQKLALTFDYKSTAKPPWGSERALATENKYERRILETTKCEQKHSSNERSCGTFKHIGNT